MELAMGSDVVGAAENCRFAQAEVLRGIMAGYGGSFQLVERATWGKAVRWFLTGKESDVNKTHRLGLVQEIVPTGQQFDQASEIAEQIARDVALAVQSMSAREGIRLDRHSSVHWHSSYVALPDQSRRRRREVLVERQDGASKGQ
jgi:enoyl-CoA hydratase/carnithine racemase